MVLTVSTNTEIVTRSFDGFETADMERFTSDWADDIVFDVSNYEFWPLETTEFRGAEEVHNLDVSAPGPDHVLALYDEVRREHGSDEPIALKIGIVYELRDRQLAHVWVFTDQERAKAFSREVSG
jgi:ketosteroid isomerase-like protein